MQKRLNGNTMERNLGEMNDTAEISLLIKSLQEERHFSIKQELGNATSSKTDSTEWGLSKDFDRELGKMQIEAYIKTWEIQSCWVHSVNYIRTLLEDEFRIYLYEARFMAPTNRKPISDRVSIYFAAEVSENEPETPVEVRFIIESRRLIHTPGRTRFSEKWLTDITETKELLQKVMAF